MPQYQVQEADKSHWAYAQGRTSGLAGDTTRRGLMSFGLSCAATEVDARNTKLWLAGFEAGLEEKEARRTAPAAHQDDGYGFAESFDRDGNLIDKNGMRRGRAGLPA